MAGTEVSSVIRDILEAFQNGLSIFRTTGRKHKRRHSEPVDATQRKHIQDSLSQRPQEIKHAYDQSVAKHGYRFELGDVTSQTTLAQILLVLNTGLIKLLNHALSNDKSRSQSRSGILTLSETAALDTLQTLSELDVRLASSSKIDRKLLETTRDAKSNGNRKARVRAHSCSQSYPQQKRPPASPLHHYGGWVRSKSDPSVVSVVVSSRVRKPDPKRSSAPRSQSAVPSGHVPDPAGAKARGGKSPPPRYTQLAARSVPVPAPKPEHLQARSGHLPVQDKVTTQRQVVRAPSMYIVPADFFDIFPQSAFSQHEAPLTDLIQIPENEPPQIPFHSRPHRPEYQQHLRTLPAMANEGRIRPPSMMTFMTASTKIGEIPEHKLPDRELTDQERREIPMPYVVPDMLEQPKRRGGRGFKFWKKEHPERNVVGAAAA